MTICPSVKQARGIMCALSVLQGGTATGSVTIHSTGATGTVPAHSYGVPIVGGALAEDALVRVDKNPSVTDGSWPVVLAGTSVTVTSVQGGTRGNLAAATEILWDPPISGIETSSVTSAGLSGGTLLSTFGALRQIKEYRELDQDAALSIFRAQAGDTPAAVLAWTGGSSVAGSVSAGYGPTADRVGRDRRLWKNNWSLFLITARQSDLAIRLREGSILRDDALAVLTDLTSIRGEVISSPQGIEILDVRPYATTPTSFVDVINFAASYALQHRDPGDTYNDWTTTRFVSSYAKGTHPAALDVPDIEFNMP